ncbi:DUF6252 family protein [Riemerella columbina]|uniref:DUF6252 family protein n=1 Tax=Riemerella columbina TaxID=103810 RepID=UPI002670AA5B|nr:DUF6252 family protein [Riemerella columbina]WKS95541.1 DUF6252 family protein [Riemerella columbina]
MRTQPFKTQTHKINKIMKHLFLALLVGLSLTTCREKEPDPNILPPATQSGANTAGCLVNGKVWVASKKSSTRGFYVGATGAEIYSDGTFKIGVEFKNVSNKSYIKMGIKKIKLELNKEYTIPINSPLGENIGGAFYVQHSVIGPAYYTKSPDYTGKIKITRLDIPNEIISGTFEFDAVDEDGNVVHITEGRFDKKFD